MRRVYEICHLRSGRYFLADVNGRVLRVPIGHPYMAGNYAEKQPLRNMPLAILGQAFADAHPAASIVDIGANVGDTAVMLGSPTTELILVEPDPYFSRLLEFNLPSLPPVRRVETVVVSNRPLAGVLKRRGGTASVHEMADATLVETKTLAEVCDTDTKLVKIDTDGFDMEIITGALGFLEERSPLLYFELECRSRAALDEALALLDQLGAIGYERFCVWDDSGLMVLGNCHSGDVAQLAESLCHGTRGTGQRTTVWGFDVLAVVLQDLPVLQRVVAEYRELQWTV